MGAWNDAWDMLAGIGWVDGLGSYQYRRAWQEWSEAPAVGREGGWILRWVRQDEAAARAVIAELDQRERKSGSKVRLG